MQALLDSLSEAVEVGGVTVGDVESFIVCMGVAMVFGVLLYLLYSLYFRDNEPQDGSLARSLILLTPSLTATFWIIQSSVILSLGLLGSLSFVRFRTPVKRSEDVTFIVIALAVAISCATMNFIIASVLITLLFGMTMVRNLWGFGTKTSDRFAIVTFNTRTKTDLSEIRQAFSKIGVQAEFVSSRTYDGMTSFVFNAPKVDKEKHERISEILAGLDREASFNIFFPNERLGV